MKNAECSLKTEIRYRFCSVLMMFTVFCFDFFSNHLLAHLSRRLIGELIVYKGIRRPSVRPSSVRRPSVNIFKRHLL